MEAMIVGFLKGPFMRDLMIRVFLRLAKEFAKDSDNKVDDMIVEELEKRF